MPRVCGAVARPEGSREAMEESGTAERNPAKSECSGLQLGRLVLGGRLLGCRTNYLLMLFSLGS
jgi:hypothetical protein